MLNREDPLSVSELIVSGARPELVTFTVIVAFAPTITLVKFTGFGLKLAVPWAPVPVNVTDWLPPGPLSLSVNDPVWAVVLLGLNRTPIVQVAPTLMV